MSLKERLKINISSEQNPQKILEKGLDNSVFTKFLENSENIILCCPISLPTATAINFIGNKLSDSLRIVAIGDSIGIQKNELLKFEPDTKNLSKDLIKTAIKLKADKIFLQDFYGTEALDIFNFINAGIKNIITAVYASEPKGALLQMEINLYQSGLNIPNEIMKKMISNFVGKIFLMEEYNGTCFISKVYEVKAVKNNDYVLTEIKQEKTEIVVKSELVGFNQSEISKKIEDVLKEKPVEPITSNKRPKNLLAKKLKQHKNSSL